MRPLQDGQASAAGSDLPELWDEVAAAVHAAVSFLFTPSVFPPARQPARPPAHPPAPLRHTRMGRGGEYLMRSFLQVADVVVSAAASPLAPAMASQLGPAAAGAPRRRALMRA
jgi:hypothetical protein